MPSVDYKFPLYSKVWAIFQDQVRHGQVNELLIHLAQGTSPVAGQPSTITQYYLRFDDGNEGMVKESQMFLSEKKARTAHLTVFSFNSQKPLAS